MGESQNWEATENATFFPSTSEYFDFILKLQNNSINENSEKAMYITSSHLDSLFDKYLSIDKQKDAYDNDFLESIKKDGDSEYEIRMDRVYKKESGLPVLQTQSEVSELLPAGLNIAMLTIQSLENRLKKAEDRYNAGQFVLYVL